MSFDPKFDPKDFTNKPFALKDTTKPWGYEIIFTTPTDPYTGKILYINAGKRISLQIHDKKQETQLLFSGRCNLIIDNQKGELETIEMELLKGYVLKVGQRHRLATITDCIIFETSTPEMGTTRRLEDDYKRPDQTEEIRRNERKGL